MNSLIDFSLREFYTTQIESKVDFLRKLNEIIDWEKFRPILENMYSNNEGVGGRPNVDVIVMFKVLCLCESYNLSYRAAELEILDRISFQHFLGYPERFPDKSTIWAFKERMCKYNVDKPVWEELQRQINACGYTVKKGVSQDATFIDADPGHKPKDTPRGDEAKTRRSRDGTFAKKYGKTHFGYKMHTKIDNDYEFIRDVKTTTASVHDSKVDLSKKGEVAYRDRGYFGTKTVGFNATMERSVRNHPIGIRSILRNKRISRKRSAVERPYAQIKRQQMKAGRVRVTTLKRVNIGCMVDCFMYNILHLRTLFTKKSENVPLEKKVTARLRNKMAGNLTDLFSLLSI